MLNERDLRVGVLREKKTAEAVRLHAEGLNNRAIAEAIGRSESFVSKALKRAGIPSRKYERQGAA